MTTMKALRFRRYGTPDEVLSLEDVGVPALRPGEALIRVRAAAVNPSDVKNLGGAFHASLPRIPGRGYAGIVTGAIPNGSAGPSGEAAPALPRRAPPLKGGLTRALETRRLA